MSLRSWFRGLFAEPARIDDGGDPEAAADLQEEFGAPDAGATDVKRMAEGRVPNEGYAAVESAEAAEEDLESEEAPPDPDP